VEQGVEEDLAGDHLLANCGPVVDADPRSADRSALEPAPVVAVGAALQASPVVLVDLRPIGDGELTGEETGGLAELVEELLAGLPTFPVILARGEDASSERSSTGRRLDRQARLALAPPVRGIPTTTQSEHTLAQYR
jgi:hypothetical protein